MRRRKYLLTAMSAIILGAAIILGTAVIHWIAVALILVCSIIVIAFWRKYKGIFPPGKHPVAHAKTINSRRCSIMKSYYRDITSLIFGFWDLAKEKLGPFFTEIKQRGAAKHQEETPEDPDTFSTRVSAIIEKEIAEMALARKEELDALNTRVEVLEENSKQK